MSLCVLALGACIEDEAALDASASDDAAIADAATDTPEASAPDASALGEAFGTFGIELVAAVADTDEATGADAYTDIAGRIYDAQVPSKPQWRSVLVDGDCELLEPHNPFCDPGCESGGTCLDGNVCLAAPTPLHVGDVLLRGLNGADGPLDVSLTARAPANFYLPRGASELAYPPFEAGDAVLLAATGGELAPFELSTEAIAPIEVLTEAPVPFGGDTATVLRWTAAASNARSRIIVRVDISHHGGQKGEVLCDTEDDGELELPESVVEGLIDLGVAGYPSLEIERYTSNAPQADAPGIALRIFSSETRAIEIPGVVSCTEENQDEVCPEGQTCLVTKLCGQ